MPPCSMLRTSVLMVVTRVRLDSARLVVAGHLVILQVEAAVHVVDAVRDLVLVRHYAQVERLRSTRTHFASTSTSYDIYLNIAATNLGVRDDGLPDAADSQIIAAESVRAVVGRIVLDIEMLEC